MFPNGNQIQAKPQLKIPIQQQYATYQRPFHPQSQGVSPIQHTPSNQQQYTYTKPMTPSQAPTQTQFQQQQKRNSNGATTVVIANNSNVSNISQKPTYSPQQKINQNKTKQNIIKKVQNYQIFLNVILGEGQYGKVHLALDERSANQQEPNYYAVKVISLGAMERNAFNNPNSMLKKEIDVLKRARHENLICLQEIQQSPNNLYIFLDYCNGGDLRSYLKQKKNKLSEEEAVDFFQQIVKGYQALNKESIIHRDLKPENIMLNDGKVKIGDFGFGRIIEGDLNQALKMSRKCTPLYGSPQILQGLQYSSKCDVWSLGIIFYELLVGKWPFFAQSEVLLVKDIKQKVGSNKNLQFPSNVGNISEKCKDLIQKMLKLEEKDRISWEEIFEHPLIVQLETDEQILQIDDQTEFQNNQEIGNGGKKGKAQKFEEQMHFSIIKNRKGVIKDKVVNDIPAMQQQPRIIENIPQQQQNNNNDNGTIPVKKIELKKVSQQQLDTIEENDLNQPPILKHNSSEASTPANNNNTGQEMNYQQQPINNQKQLQNQYQQQENSNTENINNNNNNQFQQQMELIRQKENNKYLSNQIDKKFLFLRNKALFANVALQNLWDARKSLKLPNFIVKGLVYTCGGYYHLSLQQLQKLIENCDDPFLASQDQFAIYKYSEYYKKTFNTIKRDFNEASNFFNPFQEVLAKELQKEVFEAKKNFSYENDIIEEMESLIKFIKRKSQNIQEYTQEAFKLVRRLLFFTSLPQCEIIGLKSIYGVQIFSQIDEFQPLGDFLAFDFRKFYNQELAFSTTNDFRQKIESFNQKFIIGRQQFQQKQQFENQAQQYFNQQQQQQQQYNPKYQQQYM